jgi:hypothetical protein
MSGTTPEPGPLPAVIDTSRAHSARIWDYWIGGTNNYPVDRAVGDRIQEMFPDIVTSARADRAFLGRVVRYLAGQAGISQFLDVGTGLPTQANTHEVAQHINPTARIVYVDNDSLVLVHAQALLTSTPEGACDYVHADVRDPETILDQASRTLDFTQPVAITLLGILHFILDLAEARSIVTRLLSAVPSGSYLVIQHATAEVNPSQSIDSVNYWNQHGSAPMVLRTPQEITEFFHGLTLLDPGVVTCTHWRPATNANSDLPPPVAHYCGVGYKP